ncbi:Na/Pi cotransporter family protein [Rhizobium paknamense]|uniref:Phosphate:Na+ symporter n=1 Tax=Rhizobium paknamense TaxID=1206817 RepID=A0ABU0I6B5_9HYPH|nr:Na/Pi cotransporter family protein [Rhizobium paknamense]MDQ0453765.1 phosphate:Na+ symporter [Rhizobium paknamense]
MSGISVFINLAGAVALLLWATRMVRTGIERAYGPILKNGMRIALRNRFAAAGAGFVFAVALQSVTAVALILSSFVASGYVGSAIGIATILGADIGSAFIAWVLRFDMSLLIPLLLLTGTVLFRASEGRASRQLGRIAFGLGLLLLSLKLIGEASDPLRHSDVVPMIFNYLARDWISAFLFAALLAWAFHSSVATILLVASLADRHLLPPELIIPLVLGINFGGSVISAILTKNADPAARVVPLGNVVIRGGTTLWVLALQYAVQFDPTSVTPHPGNAVVMAHIGLNALAALAGLPLCGPVAAALERWLIPAEPVTLTEKRLSALNPDDLDMPRQALSNATREMMTLCDKTEIMLNGIFDLYQRWDDQKMQRIQALDDDIDAIHRDVKFYLARISRLQMDENLLEQSQNLLNTAIRLEQAADIISQNMLTRAQKKHARNTAFSEEGWSELTGMHGEVARNARLAFNLLLTRDVEHARQLVASKEALRGMVKRSEESHMHRLRSGNIASFESSSLHLDTMRDLKELNSLFVSIGYPLLENNGMLRQTRLVEAS